MATATLTRPRNVATEREARRTKIIDVYARISVDYDGTTRSTESQIEDALDVIAERDDWTVGLILSDPFKSGWKPNVIREDFLKLMARLESGESDGLIVYDLTRFTRKPIEGERLLELAKRGIVVSSLTTEYNLLTADGRKQFRDAMTAAAFESDKISERSTRGKRKKARRGLSNATKRGYARPGLAPKPEGWVETDGRQWVSEDQLTHERAIVAEIARRILDGEGTTAIARDLNDRGEPGPTAGGWTARGISQMLTRGPALAGINVYKGQEMPQPLPGTHALDRRTWDALQAHFAGRTRGRRDMEVSLLSGTARCGRCGSAMRCRPVWEAATGEAKAQGIKSVQATDAEGNPVRQYFCNPGKANGLAGCGRVSIRQAFADDYVTEAALAFLSDPANSVAIKLRSQDDKRAPLLAKLDQLNADVDAYMARAGQWTRERIEKAVDAIDEEIAKVEAELAALGEVDESAELAKTVRARWAEAEAEGNMAVMRSMVASAFPNLTILPAAGRRKDQYMSAERFDLTGATLATLAEVKPRTTARKPRTPR